MGTHQPVQVDKQEVDRAVEMWGNFTTLLKWSTIFSVSVVALLGLIFIDW